MSDDSLNAVCVSAAVYYMGGDCLSPVTIETRLPGNHVAVNVPHDPTGRDADGLKGRFQ
jgi:hypothetical protein